MTRRNALFSSLFLFARKVFGQQQTPAANETWKAEIAQGIALYKKGRYKDSVDAFGRAVALNPDDPIPHLYLGLAWQQQFSPAGQQQTNAAHACDEFQRAIALDSSAWPPLVLMAALERNLGNTSEARRWYFHSIQPPGSSNCLARAWR